MLQCGDSVAGGLPVIKDCFCTAQAEGKVAVHLIQTNARWQGWKEETPVRLSLV